MRRRGETCGGVCDEAVLEEKRDENSRMGLYKFRGMQYSMNIWE